jgi:LytS/YehU family sensor histidine kinase
MKMTLDANLYALILTLGCVVPVYLGYFIFPLLFNKKTNKQWILLTLLFLVLFSIASIIWDDGYDGLSIENFSLVFTYSSILILTGGGLRSLLQLIEQKKKHEQLVEQNLRSELALLRTQLNPHFLFNTLHNIDTLIFENQKAASKSLVKLSDIMRYMLKDAKEDLVDLNKEINNLKYYIELEKLRLKNKKFLEFNVTGDFNELKIAPMILLPFVENAFKHSIDSDIENGITIDLKISNRTINFICENKYDNLNSEKDKEHGIGLEIIKKRLELIYPGKHRLKVVPDDSTFKVNLEIQLNENQMHCNRG